METVSRARWLFAFLLLIYIALAGRLLQLQYWEHFAYADTCRRQRTGKLEWSAIRGPILDARGRPLAVSVQVRSCALDPLVASRSELGLDKVLSKLSDALSLSPVENQKMRERAHRKGARFVWARRKLSDAQLMLLREESLPGVVLPREYVRQYPNGPLAAHCLGFTDIDGNGLEGLEMVADSFLKGTDVSRRAERDARNRKMLDDASKADTSRKGLSVELTIDASIQKVVEEELDLIVEKYTPLVTCSLVMDPYSGDILAMASRPAYDPEKPADVPEKYRLNKALAAQFEPGSTFKPVAFVGALEHGVVKLNDRIHCEGGAWRMACGRVLHDAHGYGSLSAENVLVKSSNIGIAKIALKLGQKKYYDMIRKFGFGEPTGICLPGEVSGTLHPLAKWTSYSMGSIPMGHEVAVTPLQLANAYCAIANGGILMTPRLVRQVRDASGLIVHEFPVKTRRRVMTAETSAKLRSTLEKVVTRGTGRRARLASYTMGGKTGTSHLPKTLKEVRETGSGGYSENRYASSFVGMAPAMVPRLVVLVMVREPHGAHYGGTVAAPAVSAIVRKSLRYMNVPSKAAQSAKAETGGVNDET